LTFDLLRVELRRLASSSYPLPRRTTSQVSVRRRGDPSLESIGAHMSIVTILVIIVLALLALYLFRRIA
jgi:hypothetical protein